ncbi:hypothetical protein AB0N77_21160 [Streptomyces misionensis]|uniref:hypothetical protein n=1 Tax=Streptomyces misionensis TaxID=67331 RepID=UPI00342ADA75
MTTTPLTAPTTPPLTGDDHRATHSPSVGESQYEVRVLGTDSARAEASALVENRLRWLARRGRPVPSAADAAAPFRDPHYGKAIGLFEDDVLLGCLILNQSPDLTRWGLASTGHNSFLIRHLYTRPDHAGAIVLVLTLWASDYAARQDVPLLRAEVPARHRREENPLASFLTGLTDKGWRIRGIGPGIADDRVIQLERQTAEIRCLSPIVRHAAPPSQDSETAS